MRLRLSCSRVSKQRHADAAAIDRARAFVEWLCSFERVFLNIPEHADGDRRGTRSRSEGAYNILVIIIILL